MTTLYLLIVTISLFGADPFTTYSAYPTLGKCEAAVAQIGSTDVASIYCQPINNATN